MRSFATALAASLAVGHALAGPTHLRHMQMHAAREAEAEAGIPTDAAFWKTAVNWNTVNYGGSATAAPAAPTAEAQSVHNVATTAANSVAAAVTSSPVVSAVKSAKGGQGSSPSASSSASGPMAQVSGALQQAGSDAQSLITSIGDAFGLKPAESDGTVSSGSNGPYTMEISNSMSSPVVWFCWGKDHGYQSSFMNAVAPNIAVGIPAGQSQTLSFTNSASGACSFGHSGSSLTSNGQMDNTWLEYTFQPGGVVDVSREVSMTGDSIAATVGSTGCKSNMSQCVFVCTDGTNSCEYNYALTNCAGQPGAVPGAQNGGCGWGDATSDKISVTVG